MLFRIALTVFVCSKLPLLFLSLTRSLSLTLSSLFFLYCVHMVMCVSCNAYILYRVCKCRKSIKTHVDQVTQNWKNITINFYQGKTMLHRIFCNLPNLFIFFPVDVSLAFRINVWFLTLLQRAFLALCICGYICRTSGHCPNCEQSRNNSLCNLVFFNVICFFGNDCNRWLTQIKWVFEVNGLFPTSP